MPAGVHRFFGEYPAMGEAVSAVVTWLYEGGLSGDWRKHRPLIWCVALGSADSNLL